MGKFHDAADNIQSFVNKLKPLFELQGFLNELGSLDQAKVEAEQAKEKAYKDVEQAKFAFDAASKELAAISASVESARQKLITVEDSAKARAVAIVSDANTVAEKIIKDAEYKKLQFDKYIAEKNSELNDLKDSISLKTFEYNEILSKIKEVKAKLTAFVG